MRPALTLLPSVVSLVGHALTLAWLVGGAPWPVGLLGLGCDAADGWLARRLGACTAFGALFDWAIDLSVSVLLLVRLGIPWALLVLVPVAAWLRARDVHVSGRAALTACAVAAQLAAGA